MMVPNTKIKTPRKPAGYRQMLTASNAKTSKGEVLGYYTGILYLSPANESGFFNTCLGASPYCIETCLKESGHMVFSVNKAARIDKTRILVYERELFMACMRYDIEAIIRKADRMGMRPAVRFNGTSDLPKWAMQLAREYPQVMFYDYTKLPKAELRVRSNYSITYSHSGENMAECLRVLGKGINVAVVFNVKRGLPLPETWNGYTVIDGDMHDLRFLDPKGVIVGLRIKGHKAIKAGVTPFVLDPNKLINITLGLAA